MSVTEFWESTLDDIYVFMDGYQFRNKQTVLNRYEQAKLIACFVGLSMSGKDIPDIDDLYPDMFDDDVDTEAAIKQQEKQFAMLAMTVNQSRKGKQ